MAQAQPHRAEGGSQAARTVLDPMQAHRGGAAWRGPCRDAAWDWKAEGDGWRLVWLVVGENERVAEGVMGE